MIHFTIIEIGADSESPMVGTIPNVYESRINDLKHRVMNALSEHFDSEDIHLTQEFPDLFNGDSYWDLSITVDDGEYQIRILETWLY